MITLKYYLTSTDFIEVGFNDSTSFFFADLWQKKDINDYRIVATACGDTLKELFTKVILERDFFHIGKSTVFDVFEFYEKARKFFGVAK